MQCLNNFFSTLDWKLSSVEFFILANSTKMCYTYDDLNRVTSRVIKRESDNAVISTEVFNYDKAGNITSAPDSYLQYDVNNRLTVFNGSGVTYDEDGNMVLGNSLSYTYDSKNRLTSAGGHRYKRERGRDLYSPSGGNRHAA